MLFCEQKLTLANVINKLNCKLFFTYCSLITANYVIVNLVSLAVLCI